jgi:hypothetical protein
VRSWLRKALTRTVRAKKGKSVKTEDVPPSEELLILTLTTIIGIVALTAIEVACLVALKTWNGEVFAALMSLLGTFTGIFIGRKT